MNNEYSNSIRFFDWPPEWRLDQGDTEQVAADTQGTTTEIAYYTQIIKQMEEPVVNSKSRFVKVTLPRGVL